MATGSGAPTGQGAGPDVVMPPHARLDLQSRILEVVETAIIAVDLTGRIVFANPFASVLYGWRREDLLGLEARRLTSVVIGGSLEAEIAEAIAAGETWEGTFDVRRADGSVVTVHAVDAPLHDERGELVGIVSAGVDASRERERLIAEQTRAGQVSQFLADCSTALATSADYNDALAALGRSCVPFLADLCLIDVAVEGEVHRAVAAHHVPAQQALVDELEAHYPPDSHGDHPAVHALRSGAATVAPEMPDRFLRATTRDDTHFRIVKELNFQSYICVPLVARGRTLGALTLVSCDGARRYGTSDLEVALDVAGRAALVLDNARLLSESSHVARVLQASLMPPSLPAIPGVELAARYVAFGAGMEVGGDFYDVFSVGRGAWVFALGDVCGRGAEAAVVTGFIRHTLRSAALDIRQPGRLLSVVNEVLLHDTSEVHLFATLLCGVLRPNQKGVRIALANAGHPLPVVIRADGTVEMPRHGDTVVGAFAGASWSSRTLVLAPGDVLVGYTDGLTEARRGDEFFGADRLIEVVRAARGKPVEQIADEVIDAVRAFAGGVPSDDLALVALRATD